MFFSILLPRSHVQYVFFPLPYPVLSLFFDDVGRADLIGRCGGRIQRCNGADGGFREEFGVGLVPVTGLGSI